MEKDKISIEDRIKKRVLWKEVAKEEYFERRKEINSADNKLLYLLLFVFTILSLFIQFIKIPKETYGIIFYVLTILFYIFSLIILTHAIFPKKGSLINFSENEKNDFEDEVRVLKNQYEWALKKNDTIINKKLFCLILSTFFFFVALIFTLIINLIQNN